MRLSSKPMKVGLLLAALTGLSLALWQFGGSDREPTYGGKTVTQWLDSLILFHHERDANGTHEVFRSPEAVAHDPAFLALLALGDKAVPVLLRRITEPAAFPPEMSTVQQWKLRLRWKWHRLRGATGSTRPVSGEWPEFQRMRKAAAAFILLALDTNAQGGFTTLMKVYASAPKHTSIYGGKVTGPPLGVIPSMAVGQLVAVLPHRRVQIVEQIESGLNHTNEECRSVARDCGRVFPELRAWTD